jgi:hypothetical protein
MTTTTSAQTVTVAEGAIVRVTRIIGSTLDIFAVYEPSSLCGPHSTIMHIDGQWYGMLGSRRLPAELDAMRGAARWDAVTAYQQAQYDAAYALIVAQHPSAAHGRRSMGDIAVDVRS